MTAILLGIISALAWGGGDFTGGLASRHENPIRVATMAEIAGFVLLLVLIVIFPEPVPPVQIWIVSGLANLIGLTGLILLFRALAEGQMSIAAPVSALMAAIIPVVVSSFTEGPPGWVTFIGFAFALASIWLISKGEHASRLQRLSDLRLPLLYAGSHSILFGPRGGAIHSTDEYVEVDSLMEVAQIV